MKNYLYINKKVDLIEGDQAKYLLEENNDIKYLKPGQGIAAVTKERWNEAQEAEHAHWFVHGLTSNDDRNFEHLQNFDHYASIRDRCFKNVIELGCGPFTNLGLLLNFIKADRLSLLDPLLDQYLDHPNVNYSQSGIKIREIRNHRSARSTRKGAGYRIREKIVPLSKVYSCPIEEFEPEDQYDLVILINVLEHCFNTELIFKKVLSILNPEGVFVFHDKYYKEDNLEEILPVYYDSAHPLKVEGRVIEKFLNDHFDLIYKKIDPQIQVWKNIPENRDIVYFIGSKKP